MADYNRVYIAQCADQTDHVIGHFDLVVAFYGVWMIAIAVTAHIWCDNVIPRGSQGSKLVAPGIPRFRESMQ